MLLLFEEKNTNVIDKLTVLMNVQTKKKYKIILHKKRKRFCETRKKITATLSKLQQRAKWAEFFFAQDDNLFLDRS